MRRCSIRLFQVSLALIALSTFSFAYGKGGGHEGGGHEHEHEHEHHGEHEHAHDHEHEHDHEHNHEYGRDGDHRDFDGYEGEVGVDNPVIVNQEVNPSRPVWNGIGYPTGPLAYPYFWGSQQNESASNPAPSNQTAPNSP
jgi:hypothetical protein